MNPEQKAEIESKLMRYLPFGIGGLFCWYLYVLYAGIRDGVFWIEGEGLNVGIKATVGRFEASSPYVSMIGWIQVGLIVIALVMIVIWADQHGYLESA